MGYANNCLPKAMANLGHEVHILTSNYQSYFNHPQYAEIYEKYLGPKRLPLGKSIDGNVYIHRLPSVRFRNTIIIRNLYRKLAELKPDVVQTFDVHEIHSVKIAFFRRFLKYKFFTGNHMILISFRLIMGWKKLTFKRKLMLQMVLRIPTKIVSKSSKLCYAVTKDSKLIAAKILGYDIRRIKVSVLGVDTDVYHPVQAADIPKRKEIREKLGFKENDIVCVFSGKISREKSPHILAEAIEILQSISENFKALFIGSGELSEELKKYEHSTVLGFVSSQELADYYRASDIAVWPRSVTTSIQDAAACALPVVLSDDIYAYGLIEDDNHTDIQKPKIISRKYQTHNIQDLSKQLLSLKEKESRERSGNFSANWIEKNLSWKAVAIDRIKDYHSF